MIFVAQKTSHFKYILSSLLTCYKQFIMFHPFESIKSEEISAVSKPGKNTWFLSHAPSGHKKQGQLPISARRFGSVILVKIDQKPNELSSSGILAGHFFVSNPRVDPIRGQKTQASFQG